MSPTSILIGSLAQATNQSTFTVSPSLFWLGGGVILCSIEFFLPKTWGKKYKLIALTMGLNSLIVAVFIWRYDVLQDARFQIVYWMGLSIASVIWIRPMIVKRKKFTVPDATEARTLTEILPGQTGQVLYEGCFWQARCDEYQDAISPNQTVYVLRREGNTLIVLPERLFRQ